jgi:tagatose-1,6-bisphosphate aldolase
MSRARWCEAKNLLILSLDALPDLRDLDVMKTIIDVPLSNHKIQTDVYLRNHSKITVLTLPVPWFGECYSTESYYEALTTERPTSIPFIYLHRC